MSQGCVAVRAGGLALFSDWKRHLWAASVRFRPNISFNLCGAQFEALK